MDVIATVRRAEEPGRQPKDTSFFGSYLAEFFLLNRAVSVAILRELCKNSEVAHEESYRAVG